MEDHHKHHSAHSSDHPDSTEEVKPVTEETVDASAHPSEVVGEADVKNDGAELLPEAESSPNDVSTETDQLVNLTASSPEQMGSVAEPEADQSASHSQWMPQKPSNRKAVMMIGGLLLLAGLATAWYHLNPSIYSLHGPTSVAVVPHPTSTEPQTLGAMNGGPKKLNLTLNLAALAEGHYQAWLKQDDQIVSLGGFNTIAAGPLKALDGSTFQPSVPIKEGDQILITVEAGSTLATAPSKTVILSGNVNGKGTAALKFEAIDLAQAGGTYTLATPTDPNGQTQTSGIWFASTDGKKLTEPSLKLPDAPDGWKYEGQVLYNGVAVEIGRFAKVNQLDEFSKFTTNPDLTPGFPGEDFLQKAPSQLGIAFPTDLTNGNWKVVVSLEPDQDGADPSGNSTFFLQPLKATIAQGSVAFKEYSLSLDIKDFPTGTAQFN